METPSTGLAVVQNLYHLQLDLQKYLEGDLSDPQERREARERAREFSVLLKQADWRYMGGEDVLTGLQDMEREVKERINTVPSKAVAVRPAVGRYGRTGRRIAVRRPAVAKRATRVHRIVRKTVARKRAVAKKR